MHSDYGEDASVLINSVTCTISIQSNCVVMYVRIPVVCSNLQTQDLLLLSGRESVELQRRLGNELHQQIKVCLPQLRQTSRVKQLNNLRLECGPNVQRDGCPAEYRWRPLLNAAKFG